MLALENIFKDFSQNGNVIEVLKGVELEVRREESIAVTGASGIGKSTLLHIMGTLEPPSGGTVHFEGRNVYTMREPELCLLRNREIGFVFQFHHLLPELNALENVIIPALIARRSRKKALDQAGEMLEKVGLDHRMRHRIGELSGGEQQRVAIARALIMRPKLLLADEPTGNLDEKTGEGIASLLLRLNKEEGLAMVLATHNERLAEKMNRRLIIMDGKIK